MFPCETAGCVGPGGWTLWWYDHATGPGPGEIVVGNAVSGTRALRIAPRTDLLRSGHLAQGRWRVSAQTFFPVSATAASDSGYFILLNDCNVRPPITFSMLLLFEGVSGSVKSINNPGVSLPIARGQWAEVELDIDLATNLMTISYNGQVLVEDVPYAESGEAAIQCVAVYSDGVAGMLFDDIAVEAIGEPGVCYANCDNSTAAPVLNVADFTCFLTRFARGNIGANCDHSTTAPLLNVADFSCFLSAFAAGCP
jgi:hypothetical protein